MPTSFLDPAEIAALSATMGDLWATTAAMRGGPVSLVLSRWDRTTQGWVAQPAQEVTWKLDNREPRGAEDDSAASEAVTGRFKRPAPFNARPRDVFSLSVQGGVVRGEVTTPVEVSLGIASCAFRLRLGEAS